MPIYNFPIATITRSWTSVSIGAAFICTGSAHSFTLCSPTSMRPPARNAPPFAWSRTRGLDAGVQGGVEFAGDGDEILMKNPKSQIPNPKKIPNLKLQAEALGNGASESWDEPAPTNGPLMLREDVATPAKPHPYDLEEPTAQFGEA